MLAHGHAYSTFTRIGVSRYRETIIRGRIIHMKDTIFSACFISISVLEIKPCFIKTTVGYNMQV